MFIGRIEVIDSIVSFEGQSVNELKSAFREAVKSYLDFCRRKGVAETQKSYTGIFNIRINSTLHRKVAVTTKQHGQTLNAFVKDAIEKRLEPGVNS